MSPRRTWMLAWLGGPLIGIGNGTLRELGYKHRVGEQTAHQISTGSAIACGRLSWRGSRSARPWCGRAAGVRETRDTAEGAPSEAPQFSRMSAYQPRGRTRVWSASRSTGADIPCVDAPQLQYVDDPAFEPLLGEAARAAAVHA